MDGWVRTLDPAEMAPVAGILGRWKRHVAPGGPEARGMVFGMGELGPGEAITHAHPEEEVFFVLSGEGEAEWEIDGVTHRAALTPGAAFFKTAHVPHTLRCTGAVPMRGLYCKV
jgi:mannose-6-phosphate isomerase-like protein (cupin superfamily)